MQPAQVAPRVAGIADGDRVAFASFDGRCNRFAAAANISTIDAAAPVWILSLES